MPTGTVTVTMCSVTGVASSKLVASDPGAGPTLTRLDVATSVRQRTVMPFCVGVCRYVRA